MVWGMERNNLVTQLNFNLLLMQRIIIIEAIFIFIICQDISILNQFINFDLYIFYIGIFLNHLNNISLWVPPIYLDQPDTNMLLQIPRYPNNSIIYNPNVEEDHTNSTTLMWLCHWDMKHRTAIDIANLIEIAILHQQKALVRLKIGNHNART